MNWKSLLPLGVFASIFLGSGVYFSVQGISNAFYQISPLVAILPAIGLGLFLSGKNKLENFLKGAGHGDIMAMCFIFLLAGAFGAITKTIGSIQAVVDVCLWAIPGRFLLITIFIIAALISTFIGTSMGTIAAVGPMALALGQQASLSKVLVSATVVGGAMFGDNLSFISDTTIAAVNSQKASAHEKLRLNIKVALAAAMLTIFVLGQYSYTAYEVDSAKVFSWSLLIPYVALFTLALCQIEVFSSLLISLVIAVFVGIGHHFSIVTLCQSLAKGFGDMHEILILSLAIGGLAGLLQSSFFTKSWTMKTTNSILGQLYIGFIVSVMDLLLANNVIAILMSSETSTQIRQQCQISSARVATWLDTFSCVFQGLIPYGAQLLLISSLAKISPFAIVPHVYYCYILAAVALVFILFNLGQGSRGQEPHYS
ncbi:MAG: hypothetical protein BGO07_03730 [Alphaproteobacteria bacterium 40-19]|nr:MAG: hypothetical protein BGO07_03730 [Alphaproteobacteria bacterium 40-19]